MKTPQEIQDWLQGGWKQSQYAKTDDRGRLGIDTDGVYGFQCKDFVNGYLNFMVGWMPSGNAIDLWSMDLPASIERIANTPEFIPQLGDVAVFGEPYGYDQDTTQYLGHTCVILKADMNQFDSIDQ
ncbi:MAG TPA: CHAP domain-containing protein, partial [Patescibacteria group bacterium]|nr:CHAP domain-containing protein [Patescibacteria group bacterium]